MWLSSGIQLVQQEKKHQKVSAAKRARAHWRLLYTLVNNPSLVGSRKHFKHRTAEGFLNGSLKPTASKKGSKREAETQEPAESAAGN